MKTRFEVNDEVFGVTGRTTKDCYEYYEKFYKEEGFVFDEENELIYKVFDKEIHLNEGDRVYLVGHKTVTWKCFYVEENTMVYLVHDE